MKRRLSFRLVLIVLAVVAYIYFHTLAVNIASLSTRLERLEEFEFSSPNAVLHRYQNDHKSLDSNFDGLQKGPIFYNLYIPNDGDTEKVKNALRIVEEQMQQRSWSDPESEVLYTLIGYSKDINDDFCQPHCQQRNYLPSGDEVDTLQALYDYCVAPDHSKQLVTYLHDKGSFHNSPHNEKTRRMATKAALDCRNLLVNNHKGDSSISDNDNYDYNVCTGHFMILPQYLATANMWTAKCSYVQHLLPPRDYEPAMRNMYQTTLQHPILGETKYACLNPRTSSTGTSTPSNENHLGVGRYAYERWIWSHPRVQPAEVVPPGSWNFSNFPQSWKPRLQKGPTTLPKRVGFAGGLGGKSYSRLEGRLFEWGYLYPHERPSNSSWVWDFYQGYETGAAMHKLAYCPEEINFKIDQGN
jgi:hypothetical protein